MTEQNKAPSLIRKFADRYSVDQSKLMGTLKATCFKLPSKKQGNNWVTPEVTDEQMMALLVVADQYGLNPFVKEIYAFPDKGGIVPIVGVDGWNRLMNENKNFNGISFVYSDELIQVPGLDKKLPEWVKCVIYRKDRDYPTEVTEYLDEVYKAPFIKDNGQQTNGPWQTHTRRMHRHKTQIQACRVAFGFVGIYDEDEAERIIEGEVTVNKAKDQPSASINSLISSDEANTSPATPQIEHDEASNPLVELLRSMESVETQDQADLLLADANGSLNAIEMKVLAGAHNERLQQLNDEA